MSKKNSLSNVEFVERRLRWQDRRSDAERRSLQRVRFSGPDCRSGIPRRASDLGGELAEGEVWWNKNKTRDN